MKRKALIWAVAVLALAIVPMTGAFAQEYPPDAEESSDGGITGSTLFCSVDPGSLLVGTPVTCTFQSHPVIFARGNAAADGSFQGTGPLPSDAEPGLHTITIRGTAFDGSPFVAVHEVRIGGPAARAPLSRTGLGIPLGVVLGVFGAAFALAGMLVVTRRRNNRQASA